MLTTQLLHPFILKALARAGHSSQVLITDANFPHSTKCGPNSELVYLNLAPGMVSAPEVLKALVPYIPIEAATVMAPLKSGPYKMDHDPEIWSEFTRILAGTDCQGELQRIERLAFYEAASASDVCLTIATGEQRIYGNILLTIGVVR